MTPQPFELNWTPNRETATWAMDAALARVRQKPLRKLRLIGGFGALVLLVAMIVLGQQSWPRWPVYLAVGAGYLFVYLMWHLTTRLTRAEVVTRQVREIGAARSVHAVFSQDGVRLCDNLGEISVIWTAFENAELRDGSILLHRPTQTYLFPAEAFVGTLSATDAHQRITEWMESLS